MFFLSFIENLELFIELFIYWMSKQKLKNNKVDEANDKNEKQNKQSS